jgi:hypothetical protein
VVGDSFTAGGDHAFRTDLAGGPMVDLNTLIPPDSGWTLLTARGINDVGQIVGTGKLPGNDIIHAYLLTPADSPTPAVLGTALAPGEVRAVATDSRFAAGPSVDLRPLPPVVESWEATPPPTAARLVTRPVAVLAPRAGQDPAMEGWPDVLASVRGGMA